MSIWQAWMARDNRAYVDSHFSFSAPLGVYMCGMCTLVQVANRVCVHMAVSRPTIMFIHHTLIVIVLAADRRHLYGMLCYLSSAYSTYARGAARSGSIHLQTLGPLPAPAIRSISHFATCSGARRTYCKIRSKLYHVACDRTPTSLDSLASHV